MAREVDALPTVRPYEGIWRHEFASHPFTPVLERAEGIYLYDTEGRRYLDVTAGAFCVNIGHGDRRVLEAIARQAEKFTFCHHALSNRPKAELCARIAEVAPGDLDTTYLVTGGSEAVETAIQLARPYHLACGRPQKCKVIGTWDSSHGMSLGALSVAGAPGFRQSFHPMLFDWPHVRHYRETGRPAGLSDAEWARACARELEEVIHFAGPEQISAFIATPIGAGKDYALVPPREYWQA